MYVLCTFSCCMHDYSTHDKCTKVAHAAFGALSFVRFKHLFVENFSTWKKCASACFWGAIKTEWYRKHDMCFSRVS